MIATFGNVAKWYGRVIGLVDVSVEIGPGITGLLGPNGAGKSTFLKLLTGQLTPSQGTVRLLDVDPFRTSSVCARIGFCPEPDAFYDDLTGRDFVRYLTRLHGFDAAEAARLADIAVERVGLEDVARRRIRTYSKGMRQRIKLAQAIAHEPDVLVLDEPLTGMDPLARRSIVALMHELAEAGTAVLVSSHVLHEVESMTRTVILLFQGRVRAVGTIEEIRSVLNEYPHKIMLRSPQARELARALLSEPTVVGARLEDGSVLIETHDPEQLYDLLPRLVLDDGLKIDGLRAEDVSLDAVFEYLTR